MKKIITSALVIALTIGAAQAQNTTAPEARKHDKKERKWEGFKELNLTADQKAKLKTLHEAEKKDIHEKYQAQMESILTADQKQQLAKMKEERVASRKNGNFQQDGKFRHNSDSTGMKDKGRFNKRGDFSKELGLTSSQQEQMTKIRAEYSGQFQALRNDNSL